MRPVAATTFHIRFISCADHHRRHFCKHISHDDLVSAKMSRHIAGIEQAASSKQVQVQVLLRPTGDCVLFNPVPEPVSGTRPGPAPEPGFLSGAVRGEVRARRMRLPGLRGHFRRPWACPRPCMYMWYLHMHAYTPAVGLQLAGAAIRASRVWYAAPAVRGGIAAPPLGRACPLRC